MAKKNLVGIAKKRPTRKSAKKPVSKTVVNTEEKKVEEVKKITPEEERNLKAKAKVEELLQDSPIINLDKKEEKVVEPEEEVIPEQPKGVDWLEEQVLILTQENQVLESKIQVLESMGGTGNSDEVSRAVLALFNELQSNHIKLGMNQQTGVGNFRIYCPGFLNRMITFFPFLEEYKQY